jgi:hypothetical protein
MAVGILTEAPEGSEEQYFDVNRQMFGGKNNPDEPPQGLIVHTAGTTSTGGFRIFDVWESREDYERFEHERPMPAVQETIAGSTSPPAPPTVSIYPLYAFERA